MITVTSKGYSVPFVCDVVRMLVGDRNLAGIGHFRLLGASHMRGTFPINPFALWTRKEIER